MIRNYNVAVAAGEQVPMIANSRARIPAICERKLILAAYTARIYDMIGRTIDMSTMFFARLNEYKQHKEVIDNYSAPDPLPAILKSFNIVKALDMFSVNICERVGTRKVALSYIIRDDPNPGQTPAQMNNSAVSQGFDSIMDELIAYAPHNWTAYAEDNATVLQILIDINTDTSAASSIRPHTKQRDGRSTYFALLQHNCLMHFCSLN